jgi:hypothetical protein
MAGKLKTIQKADGYWSPSLLSDPAKSPPESSGTAFFTYGLAWGIKAGSAGPGDFRAYCPQGLGALTRAVHPDGKFGYVQPVSDRPESVSYDDTQFYGVGAFLLAATAVGDLDLKPGKGRSVSVPRPRNSDATKGAIMQSATSWTARSGPGRPGSAANAARPRRPRRRRPTGPTWPVCCNRSPIRSFRRCRRDD